jgi:hypothetical protein
LSKRAGGFDLLFQIIHLGGEIVFVLDVAVGVVVFFFIVAVCGLRVVSLVSGW